MRLILCFFYASFLYHAYTQFTTPTQEDANTEIGYLLVTLVAW